MKWGNTVSSKFTVSNGVKEGGVLSPILFAIHTDGLLKRLKETGVGSHMGSRFAGALAYADDIMLLAPCKSALSILVSVCEKYASEFDILFNGSKSKLLFFKGRFSNGMESGIMVNRELVNISDNAVHLGHIISSSDRESISLTEKVVSGKALIVLHLTLVIHTLLLSVVYLNNFVVVFMVHHYGI